MNGYIIRKGNSTIFSSPRKLHRADCCHFESCVGLGISVVVRVTLLSFLSNFLYVMGKALSGKQTYKRTGLVFFASYFIGSQIL